MVLLTAARSVEIFIFSRHLDGIHQLKYILLSGLRIDTVLIFALFILPVVSYAFLSTFFNSALFRFKPAFIYWATLACLLIVFFELITPWYMFEYGARPERKFFEYLDSPREVFLMLWGMYGFLMLGIVAVMVAGTPIVYRLIVKTFSSSDVWSLAKLLTFLPIIILLMLLGIRSSFDHRPINPSTVAFTDSTIANALPLNSLYTVLYAFYRIKDEASASEIYGSIPQEEIFQLVSKEHKKHNPESFNTPGPDTVGITQKNLVIVLEESLGARFVGRLGGADLTPNLDRLANEGWWFDRLYATGTRSVRGIEAVVTGFLPTPGRSVVKLPNSKSNFFTLASLLRQHGYRSRFYYGGYAHFDNMKEFFLGNGFHEVVEQDDFINPGYTGSWGVSDGDVFERIHQDLSNTTSPLLSVVLTTSNHTPFDFPADSNARFEGPTNSIDNAIRYADAAFGKFIARAKTSNYWQNTVFLVVADHDRKVSDFVMEGDLDSEEMHRNYFPVEGFRIPGLILGGSVQSRKLSHVTSQIDLPPTLLSMIGVKTSNPMLGTDLTSVGDKYEGRAIMQYNDLQAYLEGDSLVVLQPHQPPLKGVYRNYRFNPTSGTQLDELAKIALAHALWASITYQNGTYN